MMQASLRRWLVASLLLNLFLACAIGGGAWRWWSAQQSAAGTQGASPAPRGLRYAADQLAPEHAKNYRQALRAARSEAAASIKASREGRQEVMRLLAAEQYDRSAVAAALARTREADTASRARFETAVIDFASTLTPAERAQLAEGIARRSTLGPSPRRPTDSRGSGVQ
jgi:uncharacterized membrane protein